MNSKDEAIRAASEDIAQKLESSGYDVLLDDRDERPGVNLKDADLLVSPLESMWAKGYRRYRRSRSALDSAQGGR